MLADNAVTVIIGETVRPGCEKAFMSWQQEVNNAASHYAGFVAAEINSPTSAQSRWSVIYRFDSIPNLQAWINSATRHDRLAERHRYCDGPSTQQILTGAAAPPDTLVTTVVTHRVSPEACRRVPLLAGATSNRRRTNFRGTAVLRPSARSKACRTNGQRCTATTAPLTWIGG